MNIQLRYPISNTPSYKTSFLADINTKNIDNDSLAYTIEVNKGESKSSSSKIKLNKDINYNNKLDGKEVRLRRIVVVVSILILLSYNTR